MSYMEPPPQEGPTDEEFEAWWGKAYPVVEIGEHAKPTIPPTFVVEWDPHFTIEVRVPPWTVEKLGRDHVEEAVVTTLDLDKIREAWRNEWARDDDLDWAVEVAEYQGAELSVEWA